MEAGRNFANKIWNASRFVLMNLAPEGVSEPDLVPLNPDRLPESLTRADRWILHRYNETVEAVTNRLEEYELGEAARLIYDFLWSDFCDWYVEFSKFYLYRDDSDPAAEEERRRTRGVLVFVLDGVLRLLHPFMPFISEEIWQHLPGRRERALVVAAWPQPHPGLRFPAEAAEISLLQEVIRAVRNLRSQVQLPPGRKAPVVLRAPAEIAAALTRERHQLARLAFAEPVNVDAAAKPPRALTAIVGDGVEVYLPLTGLIDLEAEMNRLQKELDQVEKELRQAEGKLNNPGFLKKAPAAVVEKEQARRAECLARKAKLQERLKELS